MTMCPGQHVSGGIEMQRPEVEKMMIRSISGKVIALALSAVLLGTVSTGVTLITADAAFAQGKSSDRGNKGRDKSSSKQDRSALVGAQNASDRAREMAAEGSQVQIAELERLEAEKAAACLDDVSETEVCEGSTP